jgi:uncharacterized protein (DUF952 family)
MRTIFHITAEKAWREAQAAGVYAADSLAAEGFIHLSTREQVLRTAARFYRGQAGLVLLSVDPALLAAELRYEESEPGERFPHLYGPLNLEAVVAVHAFPPGPDGGFTWPQGLAQPLAGPA